MIQFRPPYDIMTIELRPWGKGRVYMVGFGEDNPKRYVSVTTLLGQVSEWGLTDWARNQTMACAIAVIRRWQRNNFNLNDSNMIGVYADELKNLVDRESAAPANFGKEVHLLIEYALRQGTGEVVNFDVTPEHLYSLSQALSYLSDKKYETEAIELPVASRHLGVAGTIDLVVRDPERNIIVIDFKTGKSIRDKNAQQVACYMYLLSRMIGEPVKGQVVRIGHEAPDTYQYLPVEDDPKALDAHISELFQHLIKTREMMKEVPWKNVMDL